MQKHEYQKGGFEEEIANKAKDYLTAVVDKHDFIEINLFYKQIAEIATLAKTVLNAEDDKVAESD